MAETCPNGHAANSSGNCGNSGCVYNASNRHKGPSDPDRSGEQD